MKKNSANPIIFLGSNNVKPGSILLAMLVTVSFISGCAVPSTWARYEVCFGLSTVGGDGRISVEQWQCFCEEEIVSRFPEGFTLIPADGYWQSEMETYREPSFILMVVAPDTQDTDRKITAITETYKQRFCQEAVLEIKSPVTVDFHNAGQVDTQRPPLLTP